MKNNNQNPYNFLFNNLTMFWVVKFHEMGSFAMQNFYQITKGYSEPAILEKPEFNKIDKP